MRRKLLITGAAVVTLGGAVAGVALAWGSAAREPAANPALPPATAKVTRTTLVATKTVSGTLGYGDPAPVSAAGTGTLTWIAPVGSTVERGEPLFKLDERAVVVLYGPLPLYRTLHAGVKGTDVKQFEENLSKLGYTQCRSVRSCRRGSVRILSLVEGAEEAWCHGQLRPSRRSQSGSGTGSRSAR